MPSITSKPPRTDADQAAALIAGLKADIANIRASIASGQVPESEVYTLQCGARERQQRIDRLQRLI